MKISVESLLFKEFASLQKIINDHRSGSLEASGYRTLRTKELGRYDNVVAGVYHRDCFVGVLNNLTQRTCDIEIKSDGHILATELEKLAAYASEVPRVFRSSHGGVVAGTDMAGLSLKGSYEFGSPLNVLHPRSNHKGTFREVTPRVSHIEMVIRSGLKQEVYKEMTEKIADTFFSTSQNGGFTFETRD